MDNWSHISNFLGKHINELKCIIYASFVYLNMDVETINILMILMGFDTVFGIIKAGKISEEITFKKLFFGVVTKLLILLIPMTLALMAKALNGHWDFTILVLAILKVLVVAEGFSIITSMYTIKTGIKVKDFDIFTMLLVAIRKGLLKIISSTLHKIENPVNDIEVDLGENDIDQQPKENNQNQ